MQITQEWLDSITDEKGLTNGQVKLLDIWCRGSYVGADIPLFVANFLWHCKGYRGMSEELKAMLKPH